MRIVFVILCQLVALTVLATQNQAIAQSQSEGGQTVAGQDSDQKPAPTPPTGCWDEVKLAASDTPVELSRLTKEEEKDLPALDKGSSEPQLNFRAKSEVAVKLPGGAGAPAKIVELAADAGRVTIGNGPLVLTSGEGRYYLSSSPENIRLLATQGTRISLPKDVKVTDGQLPEDTPAKIVLEPNDWIEARLAAPVYLVPITPPQPSARLDAGALPITRGGRTLQVAVYAPGLNGNELLAETFQACFYATPDKKQSRAKTETKEIRPRVPPRTTMASVIDATDGLVTLTVPVPDGVGETIYQELRLQILGPTLGLLSDNERVWIGNPFLAGALSIVIVIVLLLLIAGRMKSDVATGGFLRKLLSFAYGSDRKPSLSLFQIYIWTVLLITGMFYVLFMSGDLLNISQQVLVLVGLAGAGSISARWISTGTNARPTAKGEGFWGMFLIEGKPDLLRLQLFLFTVAIWVYVAARVFWEQKFPELEPNALLLMGISNGVYVGAKWSTKGDPTASLRKLRLEYDMSSDAVQIREDQVKVLETRLAELTDPATNAAKAGKEPLFKDTTDALTKAKQELVTLTAKRDEAKAAYKAELERLAQMS